ncbi:uncharacterized protein LOC110817953 [Carica papaya]|uniref:uncharacterized protein LOC110817953 n=1 Tax=Carica papaya TaxID=3649 RepID=UPI000B8CFC68|nr:uncharacterized protein LOC110817953 [Carica papaya]
MSSHYPSEMDSVTDSVTSSPRSDHYPHHDLHPRVRFMCSFGGKILPRPHDNQLRYVGGDTRIVAVNRSISFSSLLTKLSKLSGTGGNVSVKYQLPNEDLDSLISVTTDEDLENMMEEYDRLAQNQNPRSDRLRLFLFNKGDGSTASSIGSLLDGSANREHWFLDALNSGGGGALLERNRSEASSVVSEVPDYLFGLDNSDDTQTRELKSKTRFGLHDNVSVSDPGSPAPVVSSPFCSTSSAPTVASLPDLPPVKTKPDNADPVVEPKHDCRPEGYVEQPAIQQSGYSGSPIWQYASTPQYLPPAMQQLPVYYVPQGNTPVQPVTVQAPYARQYPVQTGQIPIGYHQQVAGLCPVYGGTVRPVAAAADPYDTSIRVVGDGMNQQVYYGVKNPGPGQVYSGMMVSGGEEMYVRGSDANPGRATQ